MSSGAIAAEGILCPMYASISGNDTANVDQISGSFTTYYIYDIPHASRSMPGVGITHL